MLLLDVNVVLAAHRSDHPQHGVVRPWFGRLTAGDDACTVPATARASFLRLATNWRIFEVPTPRGDLVPDAVIGALAVEHSCEIVTLDRDFARFSSVRHQRLR